MNKFQDLQRKWIESKKNLAVFKRMNRSIKTENEALNERLKHAAKELQTANLKIQNQQNEIEILKINIQRLKRIESKWRIMNEREKQKECSESLETSEHSKEGSFVAESVSVETLARDSQEVAYLNEIQQFHDDGDEDFNETWVLCSGTSSSQYESEQNSVELRNEIKELIG